MNLPLFQDVFTVHIPAKIIGKILISVKDIYKIKEWEAAPDAFEGYAKIGRWELTIYFA